MQFIPMQEIRGKIKNAVEKFILQHEEYCTQLSANLKKDISNCFVIFVNEISPEEIYGIIGMRKTLLYLLPFVNPEAETALQDDFIKSFKTFFIDEKCKKPICINGEKKGMKTLLNIFESLDYIPAQINQYNLLKLDKKEFLLNLKKSEANKKSDALQIIRCRKEIPENLKIQLTEMQAAYEQEEVVPECFAFDEDSCRLRFANTLRTQCVLALKNDEGKIISKAGTNAVGIKTVQLGGVFTLPEYRGRHFAEQLLKALIFKILKMHRMPILFVKVQNINAAKLYNSLSFKKLGEYSIAYFN